jgi:chromosome partitioning protein
LEQLIDVLGLDPRPTQIILLNDVLRNKAPDPVELDLRAHATFGARVLVNRVVRSNLLKADPSYTGFATDRPVPWKELLKVEIGALSDELVTKLGI